MRTISTIIFDMDGLLIDSEPAWHATETRVYSDNGIDLTDDMLRETMGMRYDLVADYWVRHFKKDGIVDPAVLAEQVLQKMREHVDTAAVFFPDAKESIERCHVAGYRVAIASSSPMVLIEAVVEQLGVRDKIEVLHSAEGERDGKPAPDVYLSTARLLGVEPATCLAVEDSYNGIRAARAAEMQCIAVCDERYTSPAELAHLTPHVLSSLEELTQEYIQSVTSQDT